MIHQFLAEDSSIASMGIVESPFQHGHNLNDTGVDGFPSPELLQMLPPKHFDEGGNQVGHTFQ